METEKCALWNDVLLKGIAGGAIIGGATFAAAPIIVNLIGYTSGGILANSYASGMMSASAIAHGGGVSAGGIVALLQSFGATGGLGIFYGVALGSVIGGGIQLVRPLAQPVYQLGSAAMYAGGNLLQTYVPGIGHIIGGGMAMARPLAPPIWQLGSTAVYSGSNLVQTYGPAIGSFIGSGVGIARPVAQFVCQLGYDAAVKTEDHFAAGLFKSCYRFVRTKSKGEKTD